MTRQIMERGLRWELPALRFERDNENIYDEHAVKVRYFLRLDGPASVARPLLTALISAHHCRIPKSDLEVLGIDD